MPHSRELSHRTVLGGSVSQDFHNIKISLLKRYNLCQAMVQTKLRQPRRDVNVDDIVLVKEDSLVSTKWPITRITQVHTGADGKVRVVIL